MVPRVAFAGSSLTLPTSTITTYLPHRHPPPPPPPSPSQPTTTPTVVPRVANHTQKSSPSSSSRRPPSPRSLRASTFCPRPFPHSSLMPSFPPGTPTPAAAAALLLLLLSSRRHPSTPDPQDCSTTSQHSPTDHDSPQDDQEEIHNQQGDANQEEEVHTMPLSPILAHPHHRTASHHHAPPHTQNTNPNPNYPSLPNPASRHLGLPVPQTHSAAAAAAAEEHIPQPSPTTRSSSSSSAPSSSIHPTPTAPDLVQGADSAQGPSVIHTQTPPHPTIHSSHDDSHASQRPRRPRSPPHSRRRPSADAVPNEASEHLPSKESIRTTRRRPLTTQPSPVWQPFWADGRVAAAPGLFDMLRSRASATLNGMPWDWDSDSDPSTEKKAAPSVDLPADTPLERPASSSDSDSEILNSAHDATSGASNSALGMLVSVFRRAQEQQQERQTAYLKSLVSYRRRRNSSNSSDSEDDAGSSLNDNDPPIVRFVRNVVDGVDDIERRWNDHVLNAFDDQQSEDDEHGSIDDLYDVRPLLAVSMGVTLFLLTRASRGDYSAELDRAADDGNDSDDMRDHPVVDLIENNAHTVDWAHVSDLRSRQRNIVIVTTAALPWMTGTAVNPLLRAVYLAKAGHIVTLVVPWLESPEDQRKVYPKDTLFTSREQQKAVILSWAHDQIPDVDISVRFYEGVYSDEFGSILPLGDITAMFADDAVRDVCILEEPEHLTWHHTGARWSRIFSLSIGVVHTNYLEYAKKHGMFGPQRALFLNFLNQWVCRSYCHRVIKLSDAVQSLPHSVTCNVHGVRDRFLEIGKSRRGAPFLNGAYFLGKVLWAKGYAQLVELMEGHHERTGEKMHIDFFGAGPDLAAVKARVRGSFGLSEVQIHGVVVDHASEYLQRYKVYVNPSKSDVVCTATAEALAMGKFVVVLRHPSNVFFSTFENCLVYETAEEFSAQVAYALANEPVPLSDSEIYRLSWEAATERFYDAARVLPDTLGLPSRTSHQSPEAPMGANRALPGGRVDSALAATHKTICSTLVTPPSAAAVRARYRAERRYAEEMRRKAKKELARTRSKRTLFP